MHLQIVLCLKVSRGWWWWSSKSKNVVFEVKVYVLNIRHKCNGHISGNNSSKRWEWWRNLHIVLCVKIWRSWCLVIKTGVWCLHFVFVVRIYWSLIFFYMHWLGNSTQTTNSNATQTELDLHDARYESNYFPLLLCISTSTTKWLHEVFGTLKEFLRFEKVDNISCWSNSSDFTIIDIIGHLFVYHN